MKRWQKNISFKKPGDFKQLECLQTYNRAFRFLKASLTHTSFGIRICLALIEPLQYPKNTLLFLGLSFQIWLPSAPKV